MTDLDPRHYVWTAREDGPYWAYCYCARTSPRAGVRADAIKLGEHHVGDAKFRFIEEGIPFHFEVPSEFIGRGVDPTRVDMYSDPGVGDTWTATALDDDGTAMTISQDADSTLICGMRATAPLISSSSPATSTRWCPRRPE